ncbi:MAG TPA: hypothetical protein VGL77_13685 [Armatimonadota bacterium]|jgi:hypothetical protein
MADPIHLNKYLIHVFQQDGTWVRDINTAKSGFGGAVLRKTFAMDLQGNLFLVAEFPSAAGGTVPSILSFTGSGIFLGAVPLGTRTTCTRSHGTLIDNTFYVMAWDYRDNHLHLIGYQIQGGSLCEASDRVIGDITRYNNYLDHLMVQANDGTLYLQYSGRQYVPPSTFWFTFHQLDTTGQLLQEHQVYASSFPRCISYSREEDCFIISFSDDIAYQGVSPFFFYDRAFRAFYWDTEGHRQFGLWASEGNLELPTVYYSPEYAAYRDLVVERSHYYNANYPCESAILLNHVPLGENTTAPGLHYNTLFSCATYGSSVNVTDKDFLGMAGHLGGNHWSHDVQHTPSFLALALPGLDPWRWAPLWMECNPANGYIYVGEFTEGQPVRPSNTGGGDLLSAPIDGRVHHALYRDAEGTPQYTRSSVGQADWRPPVPVETTGESVTGLVLTPERDGSLTALLERDTGERITYRSQTGGQTWGQVTA